MKKSLIIITILISLIYNNSLAQRSDNIDAAGAAIAGAAVGLLGGAIQINIIKESLENEAVEWVLDFLFHSSLVSRNLVAFSFTMFFFCSRI